VKLFRRRKPENAEEEDELLLDADAAEEASIREITEAETGASTDPPAQAGAVTPADDPLAQMRADAAAEVAAAQNLPEGAPASPQPVDALDADLMDLFLEAKNEVQESTLASELPDIPIQDLLGDLVSVSRRLGVKPRPRLEPNPGQADERGLEPDQGGK
jgi:hypothetical protein